MDLFSCAKFYVWYYMRSLQIAEQFTA